MVWAQVSKPRTPKVDTMGRLTSLQVRHWGDGWHPLVLLPRTGNNVPKQAVAFAGAAAAQFKGL
jgi:hypothetical protein